MLLLTRYDAAFVSSSAAAVVPELKPPFSLFFLFHLHAHFLSPLSYCHASRCFRLFRLCCRTPFRGETPRPAGAARWSCLRTFPTVRLPVTALT